MKKINTWDDDFPELPVLVLGLEVSDYELENDHKWSRLHYNFKNDKEWFLMTHQSCGLLCRHPHILGTVLQTNEETRKKFVELIELYFETNLGIVGITVDELNEYRKNLKFLLGVDCNYSHSSLEESIFPVDLEYLKNLTTEELPENLDDLIIWENSFERICGSINRWKLWIIGENSD